MNEQQRVADGTLTWSDLWGMDPDYPLTDRDQAEADIARLTAELEDTKRQLNGARLALAVVKDALAAERAAK
ncbi:hypothetical protein [uncultured Nocardioides sp.]|jgi:hypothetical protein|uniref:hypothetical protein n=1 Tax=uncultured Nocardioides sp. TaxID=198441 RepID=UPI00260F0223|nr:hypothetical protein [uncultured Nocardioides sp.]HRD59360.1 hypothetical protein [Nocardioides sp.]